MTTPTKEQCVQWARECGFGDGLLTWQPSRHKPLMQYLQDFIDAAIERSE